jgi:hypothetical protein
MYSVPLLNRYLISLAKLLCAWVADTPEVAYLSSYYAILLATLYEILCQSRFGITHHVRACVYSSVACLAVQVPPCLMILAVHSVH